MPGDGGIFTCTMYPEIKQEGHGDCPKCGMDLEPRTAAGDEEEENPELTDISRRFRAGLFLTVPLVFVAMGGAIPGVNIKGIIPAGILYPSFGIRLSPMIAVAMSFSSVPVVGNALRLRKARL